MATLYRQYYIEKIIDYAERRNLENEFIYVGGAKVESLFFSTVVGGYNVVRLVGLSTVSPSKYGWSTDPVGTTYWSYSNVQIPDGTDLPDKYERSGAGPSAPVMPGDSIGNLFSTQPSELATSATVKFSAGKLVTATGSASLDALSDIASSALTSGVQGVLQFHAEKFGVGAAMQSLIKVQTVASALLTVHQNAGNVLEQMFQNKNMSASEAAILVDKLLLNTQATLYEAAAGVTNSPTTVSQILKASGYSAEIMRSATSAVGSEIKFNVYSGNAVQLEKGYPAERYTDSIFILDGASHSSLFGRASNDVLAGGDGWDSFWGAGGDDALVGGTGVDSAGYAGRRADYTIASTSTGYSVTDKVGSDGSDALIGVERLYFADGNIAFDVAGNAGQAYRLYQAAFNRKPDESGLGFQMQQLDYGSSLGRVAQNFISSPEFVRTYGALDNNQFVIQLYQNVLHRAPDAAGLAFHVGNLASGAGNRANALVGFSESPENQAAVIGVSQTGMYYQFP